jgi:hypothetical protein
MTADERADLQAFLDLIVEADPLVRDHVLEQCEKDTGARRYFIELHRQERVRHESRPIRRRTT